MSEFINLGNSGIIKLKLQREKNICLLCHHCHHLLWALWRKKSDHFPSARFIN